MSRSTFVLFATLTLGWPGGGSPAIAQRPTTPAVRSETTGGVFTSFYENGAVRERGPVDGTGKRTGAWQLFWPNGRLAAAGSYERGDHQGEWTWRDAYGRAIETVWYSEQQQQSHRQLDISLPPLSVEDLRAGLVGMTTVGALVDRYAAADAGAAGDAERREVVRALAAAPREAVGVPFAIAEGLPAAQRTRWLRLLAAMPMPQRVPVDQLLAWRDDPDCGEAAVAVLTAWSQQFAEEWRPIVQRDGTQEPWPVAMQLGPKAFAALPGLRRQMADGSLRQSAGSLLFAIHRLGKQSPAAPWIAALGLEDAGQRAEAALIVAALAQNGSAEAAALPMVTIERLLADPCPAVVDAACNLLVLRMKGQPDAFDARLDDFARSPVACMRLAAASRLLALGRTADAEAIWRQVLIVEPGAMHWFDSRELLTRHTRDQAAVRELLLAGLAKGLDYLLYPLQRVAGDDPRVLDLLVDHVRQHPWGIRGDVLPPESLRRLRERMATLLADPQTPAEERRNLFQNLWDAAPDEAAARAYIDRGLADADAGVRQLALQRAGMRRHAPTAAQWRSLLEDPEFREEAAGALAGFPLPADLDPTPWPVAGRVLASWADGHPERVAKLIESWLAGRQEAFDALLRLRVDLRAVQHRAPPPPDPDVGPPWLPAPDPAIVRELMPEAAAEWRIRAALAENPLGCGRGRTPMPQRRALLPVDAGMVAVIRKRLLDDTLERRAEGMQLVVWLGTEGGPLLPALEESRPKLTPAELVKLPGAVCAIAPGAAIRLCEPLLEHADREVVAAAVGGPRPIDGDRVPRIPGGAAFARRLAALLDADADAEAWRTEQTAWFTVLEEGIAALPELRERLRTNPRNAALAAAIRDLGPAAAAALPELLEAAPNSWRAAEALAAVLPPMERLVHLLPLLETFAGSTVAADLVGLELDATSLATLERLAGHERDHVRRIARNLLAGSASESPIADEARRELLQHPERGMARVDFGHWLRKWPQLTALERRHVVSLLAGRHALTRPLPAALADALAAMLPAEDNNGSVFQVMLRGAPLHPRVLEQVEASTQFWNPPASDPRVSLAAQHARALMSFWKSGDAAYRARALPWLQRHPAAGAFAAEAALSDSDAEARLTPLEFLELIELLPCSESYTQATRWLRDPDLAVRRAALRAFVASRVPHEPFASQFLRSLLLASPWEEVFGPLDGLPTFCAEFARGLPTFDGRVAALRRLAVANPGDAFEAILGDMAAARRLLPELRQMLDPRQLGECSAVLRCLRHLGTDAAELLPAVEVLGEVPFLHFDVKATAAILRGESPAEPVPDWISQGGAPTDWVYAVDYR